MSGSLREFVTPTLQPSMRRLSSSWRWIRSDFAEEFHRLWGTDALRYDGGVSEKIWETRVKYVLKVQSGTGRWLAYKVYHIFPSLRCIFQPSAVAREACNYQALELLGIPMAQVLAVGETRRFFHISSAFFMTQFAVGFQDGICFLPGRHREKETDLRDEFIRRHLEYLAVLHDAGYYHRGFTFGNLLWKELPRPAADGRRMDLLWIDVATCRRYPGWLLKRYLPFDFGNLFRFVDLTEEQRRGFLQGYYDHCKVRRMPFEELCRRVETALQKRLAKRGR